MFGLYTSKMKFEIISTRKNTNRIERLELQNKAIIEQFLLVEMENIMESFKDSYPYELYTLMCSKAAEYHYEREYNLTIHGELMNKLHEGICGK